MRLFGYRLRMRKWDFHHKGFQAGFTLLEVIISVSIVALISAQILASFSGLKQASILKRSAQELSFNIRRAQNMALAIAPVQIGALSAIPQSVGIRLTTSTADNQPSALPDGIPDNAEYFFFADQDEDGRYDDPSERIEPNTLLPNGIRITSITGSTNGHPEGHIIFYTPEARTVLTNYNGTSNDNVMDVTLEAPSGDIITVRIRISGQVNVF